MDIRKLKAITKVKKDGTMTAIASTETVDRMGDSLSLEAWDFKNFVKNPILLGGHDYRPEYVIGVAENIRLEGKKIIFEPKFHGITEYARNIEKMFQEKILKAWSVGFIPSGTEEKPNFELLEVSAVSVPANPDALTLYRKSFDALKDEDGKEVKGWLKEKGFEFEVKTKKKKIGVKVTDKDIDETVKKLKKKKLSREWLLKKYKEQKEEMVELKAGRVLSKKNREVVNKTVSALKSTIDILDNLLKETAQSGEADAEKQIVIPQKKSQFSKGQVEILAMKKLNKLTAHFLKEVNKLNN